MSKRPNIKEPSEQSSLHHLIVADDSLGVYKKIDLKLMNMPGFLQPPYHLGEFAEKMRSVKWEILNRIDQSQTLMVTSACSQDGKSAIAFNCAVSIALEREWTSVLVDTCGDSDSLTSRLHLNGVAGLTDFLHGQTRLEDVMYQTSLEKCWVVPIGQHIGLRSELLASPRLNELMTQIQEKLTMSVIILDTNPIQTFADYKILAKQLDQIIYVIKSGMTPVSKIKESLALLPQNKITGIILNQDEWT